MRRLGVAASVVAALLALWALNIARSRYQEAAFHRRAVQAHAAEVARTARIGGEPRLLGWQISDKGAAIGFQEFETLVYDESDEIARPALKRTPAWRARAQRAGWIASIDDNQRRGARLPTNNPARKDEDFELTALGGHWYVVREGLQ